MGGARLVFSRTCFSSCFKRAMVLRSFASRFKIGLTACFTPCLTAVAMIFCSCLGVRVIVLGVLGMAVVLVRGWFKRFAAGNRVFCARWVFKPVEGKYIGGGC